MLNSRLSVSTSYGVHRGACLIPLKLLRHSRSFNQPKRRFFSYQNAKYCFDCISSIIINQLHTWHQKPLHGDYTSQGRRTNWSWVQDDSSRISLTMLSMKGSLLSLGCWHEMLMMYFGLLYVVVCLVCSPFL